MQANQYIYSSGKRRVSGGFKKGNMNAFIFGGTKKKRKIKKRKV